MSTGIVHDHALLFNDKKKLDTTKDYFYKRWWHQNYEHQRFICQIIEQNLFYKITIILLIFDCIFVISQALIDFIKVKSECIQKNNWIINKSKHEIEIIMKILHYMSLCILTFFVIELFMKLYVFGRDFWNINKRKMEYFDGFIIIFSYFIDIYFLLNEKNYFMEYRFEMMTSIRIWRMIRIINSVAQYVVNEEQKKKDHLNAQYSIVIEEFIDLLKHKTDYMEKGCDNTDQYFNQIDNQCQYYFDSFNEVNRQETSSIAITQFAEQLQTLKSSICNP